MKLPLLTFSLFLVVTTCFAQKNIKVYRRVEAGNKTVREKRANDFARSADAIDVLSAVWSIPVTSKDIQKQIDRLPDSLISNSAFYRLVKQDISFAVIGSQSPTPGLSLDLGDQTSLKLTGLIPSKRKIVTLDITAARAEDNVPLFANGKFNAQMSTSLSFHIIPSGHWQPFINRPDITLGNKYSFRDEDREMLNELIRSDDKRFGTDLLDTVAVLGAYMTLVQSKGLQSLFVRDIALEQQVKDQIKVVEQAGLFFEQKVSENATGQEYLQAKANVNRAKRKLAQLQADERMINKKAFDEITNDYISKNDDEILSTIMTDNRLKLFFSLLATYFKLDGKFDTVTQVREQLRRITSWKADKLFTDLDAACQAYLHRKEAKEDLEIERSRPLWTRKQLNWFTLTAKPVIYTLNSFSNDSTAKQKAVNSSSLSFFEFSIPLWYQFYDIRESGGNLWRIGAAFNVGSNRKSFKEANYITRDTLIQYPNNTVITEDQVNGIFDDGTIRRNKVYANYYAEFYRLPRRNFVPGYSIKVSYTKNAIFGNDTERRLRLELGGVLTILSPEKDKSIFTIQPYVAISNLLFETIKEGDALRKKELGEKTSAGIRIGIPIRQQLAIGRKR